MAKVLRYSKQTTERISIKGILNEDATEITYSENYEALTVTVQDLLDKFAGDRINLIILTEDNEELPVKEDASEPVS